MWQAVDFQYCHHRFEVFSQLTSLSLSLAQHFEPHIDYQFRNCSQVNYTFGPHDWFLCDNEPSAKIECRLSGNWSTLESHILIYIMHVSLGNSIWKSISHTRADLQHRCRRLWVSMGYTIGSWLMPFRKNANCWRKNEKYIQFTRARRSYNLSLNIIRRIWSFFYFTFVLLHPSESILIKLIRCCFADKNMSLHIEPKREREKTNTAQQKYQICKWQMGAMKQFSSLIDLK